jgi:hypothetical protein
MLIMSTPVIANSSGWYFLAYYWGYGVNGHDNEVFHQMNAGPLTISGRIETTAIYGTPNGAAPWTFDVHKDSLFHPKVCTAGPVAVPLSWGDTNSFSKSCGSISEGSYYLVNYRGYSKHRHLYSAPDNFLAENIKGIGT